MTFGARVRLVRKRLPAAPGPVPGWMSRVEVNGQDITEWGVLSVTHHTDSNSFDKVTIELVCSNYETVGEEEPE